MNKEVSELISQEMNDPIVEWRVCRWTGKEFPIFQGDVDVLEILSPVVGGKKFSLDKPTLSPAMRQLRRMSFMNYRKLYKRKSALSDKTIITNFGPSWTGPVCDHDEWHSDVRDPCDWGVDINDVTKENLLETIMKLYRSVPLLGRFVGMNENCPYVSACGFSKNSYLIFDSDYCEDCLYSEVIKHSKRLVDCAYCTNCELMYTCLDCHKGFQLIYCQDCLGCSESYFLTSCENCHHCLFCSNLVNQSYCLWNRQLSKEDYMNKLAVMNHL